ncbi:hypothetical protein IWQ62_005826 [Dispira parvispora]|uniref:Uncharacterized protein n=1 Tax=Dispira parvispora TaxID=1520584 RepID=A0A9W8E0N3_9FUNG|nr:hypothetical protein IWQ62_005826 [Dispira parvispora]
MAPNTSDPRRADQVVPFYLTPTMKLQCSDGLMEIYNLVAMGAASCGLLLRLRYASWLALFCSLQSLINEKRVSGDSKTSAMHTSMFALTGIITAYLPIVMQLYQKASS